MDNGFYGKKIENKRLLIFLILCFGVAWFMELFGVIPMLQSGDADEITEAAELLTQILMTPTVAALVARIFTKERLVKSGFQFNFFEHRFLFLFGWFGMTIFAYLGAILYFLIFRDNFDPNMTNYVAAYLAAAAETGTQITAAEIVGSVKADLLVKFFTAALLDIISAFGVEWGFRAYLLPKLFRKIGAVPAMLVSSLISGLWYAPLVYVGYYYGEGNVGFPVVNILAMCIFGTVTGVIYSFLALRTGSIFPSVFAHSALNVMLSQAEQFSFDGGNYFVGPSPTGIIAGLPLIIAAAVCLISMHKNPVQASADAVEDKKQTEPKKV